MARILELEEFSLTVQHSAESSHKFTGFFGGWADCMIANVEIIDANVIDCWAWSVVSGELLPSMVHNDYHPIPVNHANLRSQRIDYGGCHSGANLALHL
jgi:hypothetical protein